MNNETLNSVFTNTANAIKNKLGNQSSIKPIDFADNIANISGGEKLFKNLYIGTTEPSPKEYKYWAKVDAPKDTDVVLASEVQIGDIVTSLESNGVKAEHIDRTYTEEYSQVITTENYVIVGKSSGREIYFITKDEYSNLLNIDVRNTAFSDSLRDDDIALDFTPLKMPSHNTSYGINIYVIDYINNRIALTSADTGTSTRQNIYIYDFNSKEGTVCINDNTGETINNGGEITNIIPRDSSSFYIYNTYSGTKYFYLINYDMYNGTFHVLSTINAGKPTYLPNGYTMCMFDEYYFPKYVILIGYNSSGVLDTYNNTLSTNSTTFFQSAYNFIKSKGITPKESSFTTSNLRVFSIYQANQMITLRYINAAKNNRREIAFIKIKDYNASSGFTFILEKVLYASSDKYTLRNEDKINMISLNEAFMVLNISKSQFEDDSSNNYLSGGYYGLYKFKINSDDSISAELPSFILSKNSVYPNIPNKIIIPSCKYTLGDDGYDFRVATLDLDGINKIYTRVNYDQESGDSSKNYPYITYNGKKIEFYRLYGNKWVDYYTEYEVDSLNRY